MRISKSHPILSLDSFYVTMSELFVVYVAFVIMFFLLSIIPYRLLINKLYVFSIKLNVKLEGWKPSKEVIFAISLTVIYLILDIKNNVVLCDAGPRPFDDTIPPYWYKPDKTVLYLANIETRDRFGVWPGDSENVCELSVTTRENMAMREAVQESMAYKRMENLEQGLNINHGINPSLLERERVLAPVRSSIVSGLSN